MTLLQLKRIRQELIETLWNVNMIGTLSPDMGHTGINRNIVECKFLNFAMSNAVIRN